MAQETLGSWAKSLLRALGAPASSSNIAAVSGWENQEGGGGAYNPLNTTYDLPPDSDFNTIGVKNYNSWGQGIRATVDTLKGGYPGIVGSLRSGQGLSGPGVSGDLSTWSGGGYSSVSPASAQMENTVRGPNGPGVSAHVSGSAGGSSNASGGCPSFLSDPWGWFSCNSVKNAAGGLGKYFLDPIDALERVGLVIFGAILIIIGIAILGFGPAKSALQIAAGVSREGRSVARIASAGGSSSAGPPSEDQSEERSKRLELAERNLVLGERKQDFRESRELRLSRRQSHKGKNEPNPNPPHS